jgi:general secretion pathway protein K
VNISIAKKDRAFAVIIALVAVTVLTLLAGAFAYSMKIETKLAANTNDDEQFYWIARGGMDRASWWLALEGAQPFSSLQQYWAGGPGEGPETNGPLAGESLSGFEIGGGTVSLKIEEEEEKININTADATMLKQVLTVQGADADAISVVSDSILDWIDPDDNTRPAGAESDYYLGLTPAYYAKNAPIDNLDELELVKGVTHDMFSGSPPSASPEHQLGFGHAPGQEPTYAFGLKDVFTPYSTGKINFLTASEQVMAMVPGMDDAAAQAVITARGSEPPIRNEQQLLASAGLPQQAVGLVLNYATHQGNTYEVTASVTIGPLTHTYKAVVWRGPGNNMQIFNFYRSE